MGVSVPVRWDELDALESGAHWTVRDAAERAASVGDAWDGYAQARRQGLTKAAKALGFDPKKA